MEGGREGGREGGKGQVHESTSNKVRQTDLLYDVKQEDDQLH